MCEGKVGEAQRVASGEVMAWAGERRRWCAKGGVSHAQNSLTSECLHTQQGCTSRLRTTAVNADGRATCPSRWMTLVPANWEALTSMGVMCEWIVGNRDVGNDSHRLGDHAWHTRRPP